MLFYLETRERPLHSCPAVRAHGASIAATVYDSSVRRRGLGNHMVRLHLSPMRQPSMLPPATRTGICFPLRARSPFVSALPACALTQLRRLQLAAPANMYTKDKTHHAATDIYHHHSNLLLVATSPCMLLVCYVEAISTAYVLGPDCATAHCCLSLALQLANSQQSQR